jgi:hypothetical protein
MTETLNGHSRSIHKIRLAVTLFVAALGLLMWNSSSWRVFSNPSGDFFAVRMELAENDYLRSVGRTRQDVYSEYETKCRARQQNQILDKAPLSTSDNKGTFGLFPSDGPEICGLRPVIALPTDDARSVFVGLAYLAVEMFNAIFADLVEALLFAMFIVFALPMASKYFIDFIAPKRSP